MIQISNTISNIMQVIKSKLQPFYNNTDLIQKPSKNIQSLIKQNLKTIHQNSQIIKQMNQIGTNPVIIKPYLYTLEQGGKKIRLCLAIVISELFTNCVSKNCIRVGALIELLHCASLIIDDFQDNSNDRRGVCCAYKKFGGRRSINAANMMYFAPLMNLLKSVSQPEQKLVLIQIYLQQMTTSHLGQAEDILVHKCRNSTQLPSIQEYFRMVSAKTGSLFCMMVRMLAVFIDIDEKVVILLTRIMKYVGISFQITDDILNITHRMGKGVIAEDFHEKKFTIIIHYLRNNKQFISRFLIDEKSQKIVNQMLDIVNKSTVIEQGKKLAQGYAQKALKLVDSLPCTYSCSNFRTLISYIVNRNT